MSDGSQPVMLPQPASALDSAIRTAAETRRCIGRMDDFSLNS